MPLTLDEMCQRALDIAARYQEGAVSYRERQEAWSVFADYLEEVLSPSHIRTKCAQKVTKVKAPARLQYRSDFFIDSILVLGACFGSEETDWRPDKFSELNDDYDAATLTWLCAPHIPEKVVSVIPEFYFALHRQLAPTTDIQEIKNTQNQK